MATWNSRIFSERGRSGRYNPQFGARGVTYTEVTLGSIEPAYYYTAGTDAPVLELPIQCTAATLASLRDDAVNARSATLSYSGPSVTALLVEVKDAVEIKSGEDLYQATLVFVGL